MNQSASNRAECNYSDEPLLSPAELRQLTDEALKELHEKWQLIASLRLPQRWHLLRYFETIDRQRQIRLMPQNRLLDWHTRNIMSRLLATSDGLNERSLLRIFSQEEFDDSQHELQRRRKKGRH